MRTLRRYTDRVGRTTVLALGALLVTLVALGAYFALVSPMATALSTTRADVADAQADRTKLTADTKRLSAQCTDISRTTERLGSFGRFFPADAQQQELFDTIVGTGDSVGVTVTGINPTIPDVSSAVLGAEETPSATAEDEAEGAKSYPLAQVNIEIVGTGSVESTRAFIKAMESLNPSVLVDSVDVQNTEDSTVTVKGRTFVVSDLSDTLDKVNDTCARSGAPAAG